MDLKCTQAPYSERRGHNTKRRLAMKKRDHSLRAGLLMGNNRLSIFGTH